ncbi:MAG: winged helix-turn-helix domain-containing protein [Gemmataceae bacterium]
MTKLARNHEDLGGTAVASHVPSESSVGRWTFLTNHSHVLIVLARNPTMVLREVASQVGITERAVQRIIADLEGEGILSREKVGRQNHYAISASRPLRHPVESHRTIGDLLEAIDGPTGAKSQRNSKDESREKSRRR